jgi:signal transduction histidine kinase/CheY-like chemotaxis protein
MPMQTSTVKILVVDDEEIMLKLACDALRSQGHQVIGASGAWEALDKLKQENFDFILTDIKMPEMNGIELIEAAHKINPSMGAIFMTGYASLDTAKKAIHEGAYDYILKPFDLQEIRSAVSRAVQKRNQSLEDGRKSGISQLYDMNRILYTAGDSKSLLKLSVEFALIQSRLNRGVILYFKQKPLELELYLVKDLRQNRFEEKTLRQNNPIMPALSQVKDIIQIKEFKESTVFAELKMLILDSNIKEELASWQGETILIPLKKAESTKGFIILNKTASEPEISGEDLKLLAILGIQTTISLENQTLLIEAQKSYRELQNLQEQIIGMEKMATQGKLSSEIGHELNNYLTVILGNFQILNMKARGGELKSSDKSLEVISANLEKIRKFAQGLLDFSTLKAEKTECDLNVLIEKTIAFIKPQNIFKNISLLTRLETRLPHPVADSGQIQQVLYNLLNNAADAMGKRKGEGGTITVGTIHTPDDDMVELWIQDTGKGMTDEELKRLFTRGFTTKEEGHGIGLSICKNIVDQHRGTIHVESKLNQGTTFRIKLPLREKESNKSTTDNQTQSKNMTG